jgi:uncharacterized protein YcbK (DUF882 family)
MHMADWPDIKPRELDMEPLMEQEVNRRRFLKLGGILPLSLFAGMAGGLVITPEEALARTRKRPKVVKANHTKIDHHDKTHHDHKQVFKPRNIHSKDHRHREIRLKEYGRARYNKERGLHLYNIHTGETVKTVYWAEGRYLPAGLNELNKLMRDHYTGDVVNIDPKLFDLLYNLCGRTEYKKPFHILSGYRCPATNHKLRERSYTVASHSLHMDGMAVDLRAPGLHTRYLRKAAMDMHSGGVGYYPGSNFVHVDTGPVRHW